MIKWGEHVRVNRQYNKMFMSILVALLPTLVLHFNFGYSEETNNSYSGSDKETLDSFSNIYKTIYFLTYDSAVAGLPEEEAVTVHFIRAATRYFQYPQRYFQADLSTVLLPFLYISLLFYPFLDLFKKQFRNTPEIAVHRGGHAPPAIFL
jgi:hypothetical protein